MRHRSLFAALFLVLLAPGAAFSEIARVRGGEHASFTRIVIEAPSAGQWLLGRTGEGYAFQPGEHVTGFDLSTAFDKIPRTRISALRPDPETGWLHLTMPCVCHAVAFEVRPGVVAIDILTGPAPENSAFEAPADLFTASDKPPETDVQSTPAMTPSSPGNFPQPAPPTPGYDWLAIAGIGRPASPTTGEEEAGDEADLLLDPMRDALIRQISRGIVEGVIDPGSLAELPEKAPASLIESPGLRISNGELPGLRASTDKSPGPNLTAEGKPCLADRMTDLASWRPAGSALAALGTTRSALLSEFDEPAIANILAAARLHLALGFGAEARQILYLLPEDEAASQTTLVDLSYLIDLEPAHSRTFVGMESCDTPAALWAVLALATDDQLPPGSQPNTAAVARSFSALSQDLRRHLGPALVTYFLDLGDETTARRLRDATFRAPGTAGQQVQLMDATMQLAVGNSGAAAALAEEVLTDPGANAAEAAILLAEAAFAGDRIVPPELPAQLAALSAELRGSASYARIRRAEMLAFAMSGDFPQAFGISKESENLSRDLWEIAARTAPDEIFLTEALRVEVSPAGSAEVNRRVASRLLDHGFAQGALNWLGPTALIDRNEDRMLAAEAALALRDARLAVRLLAGLDGAEADAMRARAALLLGNADAAAAILLANGNDRAALRAEFWAGNWTYIADSDAAGLSPAAALLLPDEGGQGDEGILARGSRLTTESETARAAVSGLVQALPQQFP